MLRNITICGAILLLAIFLGGCAPSQADIEKSIREEMKSKMNLEVKSIDLKKNDDGSYTGTAIAENGDSYDISTEAPSGGKISWKATPSKTALERMLREIITNQMKRTVKSLSLDKKEGLNYSGTAETQEGTKLKVTADWDGKEYKLLAAPMGP